MTEISSVAVAAGAVEEVLGVLRGLRINAAEKVGDNVRVNIRGCTVLVTLDELSSYRRFKKSVSECTDTSLYFEGCYEQAIDVHGSGPSAYRFFRDFKSINLKHDQSGFEIELSPLSSIFIMKLADTDALDKNLRELFRFRPGGLYGKDNLDLRDYFHRFLSVKVSAPRGHALGKKPEQLKNIAEAGLYHISYGKGVGLIPLKSWERSLINSVNKRSDDVQFPLQTYNKELVAYYQMALGAESLVLSYLALYKILEYFYTEASEQALHKKMREHLLLPDFSHSKAGKLRSLAAVVRKFDTKMNERLMLQTVLEQHINKEGIKDWIDDFEVSRGKTFTVEKDIFGKPNRLDLSDEQIFPNLSTRIYQIRNALVHNKEGEESRFTPFAGEERILIEEVPLLLKITEELIQRTGRDIPL